MRDHTNDTVAGNSGGALESASLISSSSPAARIERAVVPDTDDAIAKECLREAIKMTLGPGNVNHRLAAARLVLIYTKPRPPSVVETRDMLTANRDVEELMTALLGSQ